MSATLTTSLLIELPRSEVWERLSDLSRAHNYMPGIIGTELTSDQWDGVGASRRLFQSETRYQDETVEEWLEGRGYRLRLHRGETGMPSPFARAVWQYRLEDTKRGRTRLHLTLTYTLKLGWLGRWLDRCLLRRVIRGVVADTALGLKLYYETGRPVNGEDLMRRRALLQRQQYQY